MINASFFDIFGTFAFVYITITGIWLLKYKKKIEKWPIVILLIIGILGLVVDLTIVIKTYLI